MSVKVILLYMPTPQQELLPFPPLGIAVLAGHLRRKGLDVRIDDLEMKYWDREIISGGFFRALMRKLHLHCFSQKRIFFKSNKVTGYLDKGKYGKEMGAILAEWEKLIEVPLGECSYIGFSVMSREQLFTSLCFAKYLHARYDAKIILGGNFITRKMGVLLAKYGFLDYLIVGEGEIPLERLLTAQPREDIDNLIFRSGCAIKVNRIITQYAQSMEPDFDGLPFDLYRKNSSPLVIPYELSKGCRHECNFCVTRRKKLYFKDIEAAVGELVRIKEKYQTSHFIFVDNAINMDRDYSLRFCNRLIDKNINIAWSAYYISDNEDAQYFSLLRQAGCVQLRWGIETLGQRTLSEMNKKTCTAELSEALSKSSAAGLWNHLIFMIGHPGESAADIWKFARFIFENKNHIKSAAINVFALERVDILGDEDNYYQKYYNTRHVATRTLLGIRYKTYKDIYIRFKTAILALLNAVLRLNGIRHIGGSCSKWNDRLLDAGRLRVRE